MPQRLARSTCLLPAAMLLALSACGADEVSSPAVPPSGTASTAAATPAATPSTSPRSTPSASPRSTPSASASPSAVARTSAQLKVALLSLKDLPAGFEVERGGSDDGTMMSSSKKACAPLVALMNSRKPKGSRAQAEASFAGGQEGPFVDETLDAMGSPQAARGFLGRYRAAVKACSSVRIEVPGVGSSNVAVREISFGKLGDDTLAARFRAKSGPLEGLEIVQAGVQLGDVVLGMGVTGLEGPDAEAATGDAVRKAGKKLGHPGSA